MNLPVSLANTCKMITEKMKPTAKMSTTNGSTLNPCASSVNNFIIVDSDPPAPAARVDTGVALAAFSFLAAVDFLLDSERKPPGVD